MYVSIDVTIQCTVLVSTYVGIDRIKYLTCLISSVTFRSSTGTM